MEYPKNQVLIVSGTILAKVQQNVGRKDPGAPTQCVVRSPSSRGKGDSSSSENV